MMACRGDIQRCQSAVLYRIGESHKIETARAIAHGKCPKLFALFSVTAIGLIAQVGARASEHAADWVLEGEAAWQARACQGECVYRDQLWILGGWLKANEAPQRDVWSSADGREWKLVTKSAPWVHSDLPMAIAFKDRMWMMGGWHDGPAPGRSASHQVWSSTDGADWRQVTTAAAWSPRIAAGLVEFRGLMWLLGGIEGYYAGDDTKLKNDVWSSADGKEWKLETAHAGWSPRAYHQAVVLDGKIYVFGGGISKQAKNDVWSSRDGVSWTCEAEAAPWLPRVWFSAAVYRNRLWVLGGSRGQDTLGDVWHSKDGRIWQRLETKTTWQARYEHSAFVFQDKLWIAGGLRRPLSLSNEVWSLNLPENWKP